MLLLKFIMVLVHEYMFNGCRTFCFCFGHLNFIMAKQERKKLSIGHGKHRDSKFLAKTLRLNKIAVKNFHKNLNCSESILNCRSPASHICIKLTRTT